MLQKLRRIPIGLRTLKTAVAVIIAMLVVDLYGATASKLTFAMLGAMSAVQPTFRESTEASLTQIVGVIFGAALALLLQALPLHPLAATGVGIVLVISLYNALHIRFSPGLPCIIVLTLCYDAEAHPILYAAGRVWDTAIGLGIGMIINSLIFPYDNSRQIRNAIRTLDREVISFLENMFDGDDELPNAEVMTQTINDMGRQLKTFSNQRLILRLKRQKRQLETFRLCEGKAREMLARMEILSRMERPGRLTEESRRSLRACGANIQDTRPLDSVLERDVVTNYHIRQILRLRRELLNALEKE